MGKQQEKEILKKIDRLKHIIEKDPVSGKTARILDRFLDLVARSNGELNETFLEYIDSAMSAFGGRSRSNSSNDGDGVRQKSHC